MCAFNRLSQLCTGSCAHVCVTSVEDRCAGDASLCICGQCKSLRRQLQMNVRGVLVAHAYAKSICENAGAIWASQNNTTAHAYRACRCMRVRMCAGGKSVPISIHGRHACILPARARVCRPKLPTTFAQSAMPVSQGTKGLRALSACAGGMIQRACMRKTTLRILPHVHCA